MAKHPRSADLLVNRLMSSSDGLEQLKKDPEKTLRQFALEATAELLPPISKSEAGIYYVVVISLGVVAVAAVLGAIILTALAPAKGTLNIPDVVTALGSAAIGALAGLLAPSPKES
jgi:hypothetical protein